MVPTSLLAFFPPVTAFFVLRSGLGWVFESNDVYVGAFLSHKAHCAAKPDAACCDGRCSALRRLVQRTASSTPYAARKGCRPTSMRLFPGFVFAFCGLGRAAKGAGCRLLVVCEAGVCVVRGQKTSSGKAVVTAFLPACCFILSGLHACAPGVSAGL